MFIRHDGPAGLTWHEAAAGSDTCSCGYKVPIMVLVFTWDLDSLLENYAREQLCSTCFAAELERTEANGDA